MADDSVPLPFPNIKVPQWHYQIEHVERLKGEAEERFWKAVEEDEMAPYLQYIGSSRSDLITSLQAQNTAHIESLDAKIKEAEEQEGDSEISELFRQKAMYYCRIGDKEKSIPALELALEKTAGLGARIDLVMAMVRVGLFFQDTVLVTSNITKALDLINSGGDWDRRNRLKVYRALHHLSIRDFQEASDLLVDSLSTFTATELMEYEEFVALTVLAAGVGLDRKGIKEKILASSEVTSVLPSIPQLHTLLSSLCTSSYPAFFPALAEVEQTYLVPSPLLAPHRAYYVKELRIKAYAQLLESYRSLTLERMCRSFGVGEEFMDADLSRFIAAGRLNCRIDKVEGTVVADMDKKKGGKGAGWEGLVKQGDLLLNGAGLEELEWIKKGLAGR